MTEFGMVLTIEQDTDVVEGHDSTDQPIPNLREWGPSVPKLF